jgi:hypothetical protein
VVHYRHAVCGAFGVGDYPDTLSSVRCPDITSADNSPHRVVPHFGQGSENDIDPPSKESCDVLQQDESRSYVANEPDDLKEQTASSTL